MLDFGFPITTDSSQTSAREYLVTNGIGGFAMGTLGGALTRRYHGLLVAAMNPPVERTVLLSAMQPTARYDGHTYHLLAPNLSDGSGHTPHPVHLIRFSLDGHLPVWTFSLADALLEKRIWMPHGYNITCLRYTLRQASAPLEITLRALASWRDFHTTQKSRPDFFQVQQIPSGVRVIPEEGNSFLLLCSSGRVTPENAWVKGVFLPQEAYRGLEASTDLFHAATFHAELLPGESLTIIISAHDPLPPEEYLALEAAQTRQQTLLSRLPDDAPVWVANLALAADQFIVQRDEGQSVIAGYPWFTDWGRDTMIALPGLTLSTGRPETAASILRTFARYVSRGMLPNRFPDVGEQPEYNTVDATLWYFEAIRAYLQATSDISLLRDLFPVLKDIIAWHVRGTRYCIQVDASDGLLFAGEEGVQLTWMDAKVDDWVVTPRTGKPVEINALWYNALCCMADFACMLGEEDTPFRERAAQVHTGFQKFWYADGGYCYDVLDTPHGADATLRPNQLLAVSLPHSPLSPHQQRAVVDVCARRLLTPHGLRSLDPQNPDYCGVYGGTRRTRDAAYHQGTTWGWLIGPFLSAHYRVYQDPRAVRDYLQGLVLHLQSHGMGTLSEIFDGDAPFTPRGCIAQAWTVAEVLRVWRNILYPAGISD
ncbi:MAG: glycogen debranching protein [Anaerolineae bacterium]|nr:MAG: glycogen debranching protein [Anaerolineae bacterium]